MSIDVQTEIRNTCLYDGGHFAVLMAAADCANTSTGEGIYPGIDLWAANARLKQRRTQDIIQELRNDRVLILQSENGEDLEPDVQRTGGRGRKTEYRIDLEKVQSLQVLHEADVAAGRVKCHYCEARQKRSLTRAGKGAISSRKGAIPVAKGAKNDVKGAISRSHIRTNEPSLEPSEEPAPSAPSGGQAKLDLGLPTWLPVKPWQEYLALRKKLRCANTPRAEELLILQLDKLRKAGHDPTAVIEQSIRKSWRDFFPVKEGNNGTGSKTGGGGGTQSFAASISLAAGERRSGGGLFTGGGKDVDGTSGQHHPQDTGQPPKLAGPTSDAS